MLCRRDNKFPQFRCRSGMTTLRACADLPFQWRRCQRQLPFRWSQHRHGRRTRVRRHTDLPQRVAEFRFSRCPGSEQTVVELGITMCQLQMAAGSETVVQTLADHGVYSSAQAAVDRLFGWRPRGAHSSVRLPMCWSARHPDEPRMARSSWWVTGRHSCFVTADCQHWSG